MKKSILNNWQDIFAPSVEQPKQQAQPAQFGNVTPLDYNFESVRGELFPDDALDVFRGNVKFSENQLEHLLDIMTLETFDYYVDKLDAYISKHGDVKSHYATLLRWYKEDTAVAR